MYPSPDGSYVFHSGDVVYIFGDTAKMRNAEPLFCRPSDTPPGDVAA